MILGRFCVLLKKLPRKCKENCENYVEILKLRRVFLDARL